MRDVILYIAVSLDGYIADESGGVDWLGGADPAYGGDYGYAAFVREVDCVVMGWRTFRQVREELSPHAWPYRGMETYVLTHRDLPGEPGITFVRQPAGDLVRRLRTGEGKHIWVCGGGDVVRQLLEEALIDELHLSVMPCLLGGGTRLFSQEKACFLELCSLRAENGVVDCVYRKRPGPPAAD